MATENQHFDENIDLEAGQKLSTDLKALFEPQGSVPPQVDRAIMDRANKRFVRRGRRLVVRWAGSAAAAAAVIILVLLVDPSHKRTSRQAAESFDAGKTSLAAADLPPDIDRSGRVDILDAFKLARHIKAGGQPNKKWDMNGDGLVDRKDVDLVAFAAVRLDKGVL
ncbi:MAG TPA: dockerin type I domain-containing protein [Sedimentisphaerales bacterium]|nr:dockerin type I domain-containing protein [Sedimentisphaerales bacterium]